MLLQVKRCGKCKRKKPRNAFFRQTDSGDGLQGYCKKCSTRKHLIWSRANPDKDRANTQRRLYGIEPEEYSQIKRQQKGRCAICGIKSRRRRLCVDHCHDTAKIRGLLCHNCNVGIGMFRHSKAILRAAINYL